MAMESSFSDQRKEDIRWLISHGFHTVLPREQKYSASSELQIAALPDDFPIRNGKEFAPPLLRPPRNEHG
jgi:hypothetical protein